MNQMVANLYANNTGASSFSQGNSNIQMNISEKSEEEQQAKRKQSNEKSTKKVKRKKPTESTLTDDIDGPDVEYSTTTFEDFAASESFKEV
jgi:hypothetical protein